MRDGMIYAARAGLDLHITRNPEIVHKAHRMESECQRRDARRQHYSNTKRNPNTQFGSCGLQYPRAALRTSRGSLR